jgi:hypothetical protein
MFEDLKTMDKIGRIIIVDNDSTYSRTLDWYSCEKDLIVYKNKINLGHTAPWYEGVIDRYDSKAYVVTDPDLDISNVPKDCLVHMRNVMVNSPDLEKVGLSLLTQDVPHDSLHFNYALEEMYWRCSRGSWTFHGAAVDTTFAFYSTSRFSDYKVCGERLLPPYTARHLPWYFNSDRLVKNEEYMYYLNNASDCSSFKLGMRSNKHFKEIGNTL